MKLQELFQEKKQPQQLNEWIWLVPLVATAVRIGAPALIRVLATGGRAAGGQVVKQAPKLTKKVLKVIFLSNLLKLLFGVALVLFLLYKIMGG